MVSVRLNHPHIVRLRSAYVTGGDSVTASPTLHMVLEFADGGTLNDRIRGVKDRARDGGAFRLATRLVEVWLAQICSAVVHMHEKQASGPLLCLLPSSVSSHEATRARTGTLLQHR